MKKYTDEYLLSVKHLTKRYGALTAVDDVSLDIRPGEIFALLGPNGAGKTTMIGCVSGLVADFDGEVSVAGYDVRRDYRITRRLIGLVPQELNYDVFFNVRQVLEFQGSYFGERPSKQKVDELLDSFSLLEKANDNTRWLSGGMKRRLMICKALMHDPVLLFLDEPTAGVDVELREELWTYVRALRERGTTIVLTTHYIEEAEKLADRVGIINRGRLLRVDDRETLMEEFGTRHVELVLRNPVTKSLLERVPELDIELLDDTRIKLVVRDRLSESAHDGSSIDRLLRALWNEGISIDSVEGGRSSLEDIFKELVYTDSKNSLVATNNKEIE